MIIIALSDIHSHQHRIHHISDELVKADLVLLTGDITHFGREKEAADIINTLTKYTKHILAVPGNCDFREVGEYLDKDNINLHARIHYHNGFAFAGIGGSLPCPIDTPNEYNEEQIENILVETAANIDGKYPLIFVSHQPPYNTINDLASIGKHVGSRSIRLFIEKYRPQICFTGHIHEGVGIDTIKKSKIINPGPFKEGGYAYLEINNNQILEVRGRNL